MSTMRAVVADTSREGVLSIESVPVPQPLPNEALVRVSAISLNRGEVRMSRTPRPNWRPGWDLAGIVEKAAADGTGPQAGQRVVGLVRSGAWAEQVAVQTNQISEISSSVTFTQAAALPVAGLTALHALAKGGFLLGRTVLVTGATGGVGEYALQLGTMAGARMVAHVRRDEHIPFAKAAGASAVISGESLLNAKEAGPYALILESVGGQTLADALALVEEGTKIISYGTSAGSQVTFDAQKFYGKGMTSLYGFFLFDELRTVESAADGLGRLQGFVAEGKLRATIGVEADWSEIAAIAQQLMDRKYQGKAVLHLDNG